MSKGFDTLSTRPSLWHQLALKAKLWRSATVGRNFRLIGKVFIHGNGRIVFGDGVTLDGSICPLELKVLPGASLTIGDDVVISGGSSLEASQAITVGSGTRISPFCKIIDTNWHPLRYEGGKRDPSLRPPSDPVHIGKNVSLGSKVIILPGVKIGDGATILANSVVSRSLPPNVIVEGFPPRPVNRDKAPTHAPSATTRI